MKVSFFKVWLFCKQYFFPKTCCFTPHSFVLHWNEQIHLLFVVFKCVSRVECRFITCCCFVKTNIETGFLSLWTTFKSNVTVNVIGILLNGLAKNKYYVGRNKFTRPWWNRYSTFKKKEQQLIFLTKKKFPIFFFSSPPNSFFVE